MKINLDELQEQKPSLGPLPSVKKKKVDCSWSEKRIWCIVLMALNWVIRQLYRRTVHFSQSALCV